MSDYPDDWTVGEGRARYFETGGIPADGGYSARWVKLSAGPIPFGFPNSDSRRRAVKLHDVHHVLTGYGTSWIGEAEISAWEIASGCGRHTIAWLINLGGFFVGLMIDPSRTRRAFMRGRGARNLYHGAAYDDSLLGKKLGEVRAQLAFDAGVRSTGRRDQLAWFAWCAASLAYAVVVIGLPVAAIGAAVRFIF